MPPMDANEKMFGLETCFEPCKRNEMMSKKGSSGECVK